VVSAKPLLSCTGNRRNDSGPRIDFPNARVPSIRDVEISVAIECEARWREEVCIGRQSTIVDLPCRAASGYGCDHARSHINSADTIVGVADEQITVAIEYDSQRVGNNC